jgi:hypothetical protein
MIENARFHFRYGQCHALAIALHRRTGMPLGIIVGDYGGPSDPKIELCRPVVMVGDECYLDVDGYHEGLDAATLGFSNAVHSVRLVPARLADVARFFDGAGVDPRMVRHAEEFVASDDALNAFFDSHRGVDITI